MKSIAVIGAGWAGAAAALRLSRAGAKVTVFEAARHAGGRARRVEREGRVFDNGQHLLLGAYVRTIALIRSLHISVSEPLLRLALTLHTPPNETSRFELRAAAMPEPWNLLVALLTAKGLAGVEKFAAITLATRMLHGAPVGATMTVAALIADQPLAVRRLLWEPLCIAALNTPPENASAEVFVEVLKYTFSGVRNASCMVIPTADLSALLPDPALAEVKARAGDVHLGAPVMSVTNIENGVCVALRDSKLHFEAVIVATGPQHVSRILVHEAMATGVSEALNDLSYEAITTVYFEFAHVSPSPDEGAPLRMLCSEPGQWLFWSRQPSGVWRAGIIISAHRRSDDETSLFSGALKQLSRNYRLPRPTWHFVVTEKRATYACTPEQTLLLKGLPRSVGRIYFAGDWCYPQLPATLEAAVIAGEIAADAVLEKCDAN